MSFKSAPILLLSLAVTSIVSGFILTPELLISLGPMRGSLTSPSLFIRETAELEITIAKILFILSGIALLTIYLQWQKFQDLELIHRIHSLNDPGYQYNAPTFLLSSSILILLWLFFISYFFWWDTFISRDIDVYISKEDGLIENLSALLFLLASILSLKLIFNVNRKREKAWFLLLSLGLFFIAGEEISWGQRIFDIETLGMLENINVQNENNFHNLMGYAADHIFIGGVFIFGCLMPIFYCYSEFFRKSLFHFGISVPSYSLAIGFLLASMIHNWSFDMIMVYTTDIRPGEVRELLSALGFSIYAYNRLQLSKYNNT